MLHPSTESRGSQVFTPLKPLTSSSKCAPASGLSALRRSAINNNYHVRHFKGMKMTLVLTSCLCLLANGCSKSKEDANFQEETPLPISKDVRYISSKEAVLTLTQSFPQSDRIRFDVSSDGKAVLIYCVDDKLTNRAVESLEQIDILVGDPVTLWIELKSLDLDDALKILDANIDADGLEFQAVGSPRLNKVFVMGNPENMRKAEALIKQTEQDQPTSSRAAVRSFHQLNQSTKSIVRPR